MYRLDGTYWILFSLNLGEFQVNSLFSLPAYLVSSAYLPVDYSCLEIHINLLNTYWHPNKTRSNSNH